MQPMTAGRPEDYGLPTPNHKFFEAHPTQSVELPLRLGSGDVVPKPDLARLVGHTVHFVDATSRAIDVIISATGYNITFTFFDPEAGKSGIWGKGGSVRGDLGGRRIIKKKNE